MGHVEHFKFLKIFYCQFLKKCFKKAVGAFLNAFWVSREWPEKLLPMGYTQPSQQFDGYFALETLRQVEFRIFFHKLSFIACVGRLCQNISTVYFFFVGSEDFTCQPPSMGTNNFCDLGYLSEKCVICKRCFFGNANAFHGFVGDHQKHIGRKFWW